MKQFIPMTDIIPGDIGYIESRIRTTSGVYINFGMILVRVLSIEDSDIAKVTAVAGDGTEQFVDCVELNRYIDTDYI